MLPRLSGCSFRGDDRWTPLRPSDTCPTNRKIGSQDRRHARITSGQRIVSSPFIVGW
jgi:hypothetical protein